MGLLRKIVFTSTKGAKMSFFHVTMTLLLSIAILFAMILQETFQNVPSCHGDDDECPPGYNCNLYISDYKCVQKCSGRDDDSCLDGKKCHCYEDSSGEVTTNCECVDPKWVSGDITIPRFTWIPPVGWSLSIPRRVITIGTAHGTGCVCIVGLPVVVNRALRTRMTAQKGYGVGHYLLDNTTLVTVITGLILIITGIVVF